jgi:hypothetical protein
MLETIRQKDVHNQPDPVSGLCEADGRQPFLPANVFERLPFLAYPSVLPMRGGKRPLLVGPFGRARFDQRRVTMP